MKNLKKTEFSNRRKTEEFGFDYKNFLTSNKYARIYMYKM